MDLTTNAIMPLSTAPVLLIGLGARILIDTFTRPEAASIQDFILFGIWQGVCLHYSSKVSGLPYIVASAIAAKLLFEFNLVQDVTRSATTLSGVALGILSTEFLSQFFDSPKLPEPDRRRKKPTTADVRPTPRRERLVQFQANHRSARPNDTAHTISDITSIDSTTEMLSTSSSMSASERLEREIKNLRTRASLADSERRRFKEERKWAISQGNEARADQMKWQVNRYAALMQSFHREADNKLIEGQCYHLTQPSGNIS